MATIKARRQANGTIRYTAIVRQRVGKTIAHREARAGERYREIRARDGVRLRLVPTNGAVDNVRLLKDPHSGIDAGLVLAGTIAEDQAEDLVSLGTLFYEEAWLFCRSRDPMPPPSQWDGLQLIGYSPEQTQHALLAKELDAGLIVTGWDSSVVQSLARAPEIRLLGFTRADAYVALYPFLNKLVLPKGVASLAADRPPQDTPLIASKASLAVRSDLHPALQFLLLRAATEVHSRPGIFQRVGEFPAAEEIDLPLSTEARRYYRSGPNFLQRTFPFWLAEFAQRMLILMGAHRGYRLPAVVLRSQAVLLAQAAPPVSDVPRTEVDRTRA